MFKSIYKENHFMHAHVHKKLVMMYIKRLITYAPRNYCISAQHSKHSNNTTFLIEQQSLKEFEESLPIIFYNVFAKQKVFKTSGVEDHIRKITEYGSGGKKLRGALTLHTYQSLKDPKKMTQQVRYQAHVLALAVELTQFYFIISDDIQDQAKTRRGKACWHLLPDVGPRAVNDQSLLRSFIYEMLKATFEHEPSYGFIADLFGKAFLHTGIGQHLDYTACKMPNRNYSHFTMDLYYKIIYYKTQFYTVQLPVLLGMVLANRYDAESQEYVENVCVNMSRLFQMQDDYIDCFGNTDVIGKTGTDIQEGKCTWLAVTALERCTNPQRIVFKACYGSGEPSHIERIMRLYEQLQIPTVYKEEEKILFNRIMQQTQKIQNRNILPSEVFVNFLNVIYNRKS